MAEVRPFRVGVVGAGHISEFHLRALRRVGQARVVGLVDLDLARARAVAGRFGIPPASSLDELFGQRPDVVHVLTPPASHAPITLQALEHGCHVLVEKPLATSVESCDRILQAARAADRVVCVDHAMLRDPFVVRALDAVRAGAVGEVLSVDYAKSQVYPPYPGGPLPVHYREGGYPFRDVGVHALYLMQAFLGDIEEVTAQYRTGDTDPNLHFSDWRALVRCRRGTGQVHLSWDIRPCQNVLTVQGTRGVLRADLFGMAVTTRRARRLPELVQRAVNATGEGWQLATQVPWNVLRALLGRVRRYHGLQQLVEDFYTSLRQGQPPPVSAAEARPIVDWTERIAREADAAKEAWLARFPSTLSAPILVTGGGGFIGRHLVRRLLADGRRLRLLLRREPPAELRDHPGVEVVIGDLGDPAAVERAAAGVEQVFHLGAAIKGSAADFDRGTIVGTRNVVQGALAHGVRQLVYVSSLSVLHAAAAAPDQVVRESWPLEPHPERRGHYTRTKLEAENIVRAAVAAEGLPAVILRPGLVFGPEKSLLGPAVGIRRGSRVIVLGNGRVVLPLVHVEDVVDALLLASEKGITDGSIFHLVDTTRLTQDDVIRRYGEGTGQPLRAVHLPRPLVYAGALGVQMLAGLLRRPAPLSIYRVRSALARWVFDCGAARERLGWQPRVGVQGGLEQALAHQAASLGDRRGQG